jgi:hypothetical protein
MCLSMGYFQSRMSVQRTSCALSVNGRSSTWKVEASWHPMHAAITLSKTSTGNRQNMEVEMGIPTWNLLDRPRQSVQGQPVVDGSIMPGNGVQGSSW